MNNTAKRLPMKVKWLFASGEFAKTLLVVMTAAFSLFFYTDVLGMDAKIVATIILIAKIWDFINDPMMGALVDRTRSKEGKCRMWLKYMSVPGGVVLAESEREAALPERAGALVLAKQYYYGKIMVSRYEKEEQA